MTDSVIQFNYSDNVHMVSIYIESDTHIDYFIPFLCDIIEESDYKYRRKSWNYTVAEIISRIVTSKKYNHLVKFIDKTKIKNCNVIYKHTVSIIEDYYKSNNTDLIDFIQIKSIYPGYKEKIFEGKISDFYSELINENNYYLIETLNEEIEEKQNKLKELKKIKR